ncbi:hypothetical protein HLK59_10130 [Streptomyces sp. S3(2020)]|uniref:hypothetical protein n=1 Tax=Streptomyces sp. S3(2020) TaxID=2732044 RepID=UPI001489D99E|nr:hypothetical protein [Streptomyces sp. S3(2020)]NNN30714.1 hypothetical protein [Streptomyces sp. S3(2020)]
MSSRTISRFAFSRWEFLSAPLPVVLAACQAMVTETRDHDRDFTGGLVTDGFPLEVQVPAEQNTVERDGTIRGLLAHWHGVDTTDWPVPMVLVRERAA